MDFIHELEKKAKILGLDKQPYTIQDVIKDAAIFGMADGKLREKALAEDPNLDKLTRWGQAKEAGREDAHNLKENSGGAVKRIGWTGNEKKPEDMDESELNNLIKSLNVMKIKKAGKYSNRSNKDKEKEEQKSCSRCTTEHQPGRCPAYGKDCYTAKMNSCFNKSFYCTIK